MRAPEALAEVRAALGRARTGGIEGHGALVEALIGLGELVQGLADRAFAARGADAPDPLVERLTTSLVAIARLVVRSWGEGFRPVAPVPGPAVDVPDVPLTLKLPEGYAFYALYPEAIAAAARTLRLDAPPRVIGIRSIGTGLAAIAAAALDAPPPMTVRPVGHPFARHLAIDEALAKRLLDEPAHYVIVDEGPGLSGSSFAAVAEWLEARGVPPTCIAFLPSHGGDPGAQATPATRARWEAAQRPVVSFDKLIPPERLRGWVEALVGPLALPLADLSGGRWRSLFYPDEARWPPAQPGGERLKWLATGQDGQRWLVKFAGLGRSGTVALDRARRLAAAGWVGAPAGRVHGMLVQRWVEGRPLTSRAAARGHAATIGRYLADRVALLPPPDAPGADPEALAEMARNNVGEALGEAMAERFGRWLTRPAQVRPVAIDGRLGLSEWIMAADGLRKADALDGDRSHDLIGAQDIAWDAAGAIVELGLGGGAREALLTAMAAGGAPVPEADMQFWIAAYLGFRIGAIRMTLDSLADWPEERARNLSLFNRYIRLITAFSSR